MQGCQLSQDECATDEEVTNSKFNMAFLKPQPNIAGDNPDEMIMYLTDASHFYYLDPTHVQTNNIFLMESTVRLNDNIWDIFEFSEYELEIIEYSRT